MQRDFYQDLQIERDASDAEIAKAYRNLSLKWHPKLSKENLNISYQQFCQISEAYEVLSDPVKRNFYDKYGEEKLKKGFFSQGNFKGGYKFNGNPEEIFEKFFGVENPFAQIYDFDGKQPKGSLVGFSFGEQQFLNIPQPQELVIIIECTLNELYNGCQKKIQYTRTILNQDGKTTREIKESKQIEIKPGFNQSNEIRFQGLGNQSAGVANSDLVFKIKELPHIRYKRVNYDLYYTAEISLAQALCSEPITIQTLDQRNLFISMDQIINPKTQKKIQYEGLPIYNKDEFKVENFNKTLPKGDLIIQFDIKFPDFLEDDKLDDIIRILNECYQ